MPIDATEFVTSCKPLLEAQNLKGLMALLRKRWDTDQITALLSGPNCDARKVAALALSLVGEKCCIPRLAEKLRDPDPMINQMAEHALWSIWFRSGCPEANHELARGAQHIHTMEYEPAIEHFDKAVRLSPECAEAYNQRAIAYYLMERYENSVADCRRAIELMPCHFGAWAGLGHAYTHLARFKEAAECYRKALHINPHLDCLREAIDEISRGR